MSPSIGVMVQQRSAAGIVGRDRELATLLDALGSDGPNVIQLHGVAGIGKTTLMAAFAARARAAGAQVLGLDCRALEPTDRGLLSALGGAIGVRNPTVVRVSARIEQLGQPVVILDHYEHFRLLDTWIRQVLVPALPDNARIALASREPPVAGWLAGPGLADVVQVLPLGPLEPDEAVELLTRLGIPHRTAQALNRTVRGHPLAIRLAAAGAAERPELGIEDLAAHRVVEELSRLYLEDVPDPATRQALEAASVIRRATSSLLAAMLPDLAPHDALERLRTLPFVETRQDGLSVHEAVQVSISASLHASQPVRHRDLRRRAWQALREEVRDVGSQELWRYTADMLYLIENPVVREAFFPSGAQPLAVEPALVRDWPAIERITLRHDGEAARDLMRAWWEHHAEAFSVVRDRDGAVAAYLCVLDHQTMVRRHVQGDAVVDGWRRDLQAHPPPSGQLVLGLRRWLDLEHGELPCASQAAAWLDVKRTYMALRPRLRKIYVVVEDPSVYLPVVTRLGFRAVGPGDGVAPIGERTYTSVALDFGPASVDGWLAGLVAAELGLAPSVVIDREARELKLDGRRLRLTPLEFGVLSCLQEHEGRAVSRTSLLEAVWGYDTDVGSNVVDAIVRRLRRKLGDDAAALETIRGTGYRLSIH